MANKLVIFPVGKQTQAEAYRTWVNEQSNLISDLGDFAGPLYNDVFGQWVVPYLGPPFEYPVGTPIAEPAGGEVERADGVLHDSAVMPEDG